MVHNVNCISRYAESDQCGDEKTWGHGGYGEAGSGLVGRIMGKPGVSKGGQIVMISDVNWMRPRAYMHWNKVHENPTGWTEAVPLELLWVMEGVRKMVIEKEDAVQGETRKVFMEKPHTTQDNYFSGDLVMDLLGNNGSGATMECRSEILPSGVPNQYLHKKKTETKA